MAHEQLDQMAETLKWLDRTLEAHGYPEGAPIRRRIGRELDAYRMFRALGPPLIQVGYRWEEDAQG